MEQEEQHDRIKYLPRSAGGPLGPLAGTGACRLVVNIDLGAATATSLLDGDGDQAPAFRVRLGHGALQVADGRGRHLGTFASGAAAIWCGWRRSRIQPLRTGKKQP